jgi:hypothetical protein
MAPFIQLLILLVFCIVILLCHSRYDRRIDLIGMRYFNPKTDLLEIGDEGSCQNPGHRCHPHERLSPRRACAARTQAQHGCLSEVDIWFLRPKKLFAGISKIMYWPTDR